MARPTAPLSAFELTKSILASPRLSAALTTTIVGTTLLSFALRQLMGWAGFIAILSALVALAGLSLAAQWEEIGWNGLLPISLLGFLGWTLASVFWSQHHWATLGGLAYLAAFTAFGIYVALVRDTIQIVRTFGDVLRFVLGLSLAMEILSGILIDTPIRVLGITGNLAELGPVTGLLSTTDQLGLVSVVALITFGTELRTRSVTRGVGIGSVILGVFMLVVARAPLAFGAMIVVIIAAAILYGLRRVSDGSRRFWQLGVLALIATAAILAWRFRSPIVTAFNATGALNYRLNVWQGVWSLTQLHSLQGWGWVGAWPKDTFPVFDLHDEFGALCRVGPERVSRRLVPAGIRGVRNLRRLPRARARAVVAARVPPEKRGFRVAEPRAHRPGDRSAGRELDPRRIRVAHARRLLGEGIARAELAARVRIVDGHERIRNGVGRSWSKPNGRSGARFCWHGPGLPC